MHVQFIAAQSAVQVAPSSHVMVHSPVPPQFIAHVAPALHVIVHAPARQLNVQSAPLSQTCVHPFPSSSQLPVQTLPSLHVIPQPAVLQLCVQSSPSLQTQGAFASHVFVDVGPASGTDPLDPDEAPLEPLEPAEPDELDPVSSPSPSPSLLHAAATTQTRATATTAADRSAGERCKFTLGGYERVARVSSPDEG